MSILSFEGSRPSFDPARCLNRIQRKFTCTVCTEQCPMEVFSLSGKEPIRWNRCTDCGLCVTLCPDRCFAPSSEQRRRLTEEISLKETVSFGCRREETLATVRAKCLLAVPWELIAACALSTDVVLYTGACEDCGEERLRHALPELLGRLKSFLGEERFDSHVHLLQSGTFSRPDEAPEQEKTLSRRALFTGLGQKLGTQAGRAVARKLPFLENGAADGLQFRKMLAGRVQEETGRDPSFRPGVELPRYTACCTGCGICEKLCPQKAIAFEPSENGKIVVYITPWKCTACGLCVKACPVGGIDNLHTVRVPRMTELALVQVEAKTV